ncbi:mannose-1-phosphate guanylyltransferase [Desulfonatronum zhilinae]|nr:mannose-1-phosphate guanylyltransferase [Desulfonatronum zhilinae]
MQAMLLAAGQGLRLRPYTNTTPKCLMPIGGKPLLEIWLERLTASGIGPFLINTHYLAEQVTDYIYSSPYRDHVTLVHEPDLLGTAGTLIANLDFFQGRDGLLIHADNYCLADLKAFAKAHAQRPPECLVAMMTFRTATPSSCGIVELDDQNVVTSFHEKARNPPGNLANGAVYILSARFLDMVKTRFAAATDFSTEVIVHLTGKIYAHETTAAFVDIGTPESYHRANEMT